VVRERAGQRAGRDERVDLREGHGGERSRVNGQAVRREKNGVKRASCNLQLAEEGARSDRTLSRVRSAEPV
jgi:hypothetical protein